jgi:hypothetical protein
MGLGQQQRGPSPSFWTNACAEMITRVERDATHEAVEQPPDPWPGLAELFGACNGRLIRHGDLLRRFLSLLEF